MYLKESEIIKYLFEQIVLEGKDRYGNNLKIKKQNIYPPKQLDIHKEYKNGQSSSMVEIDFELMGWSSFGDEELEKFIKSIVENDENLYPIVDITVFDLGGGGRRQIKLNITFVYTGLDGLNNSFESNYTEVINKTNSSLSSTMLEGEKNEIIKDIELKLAEIFTLLNRLKKS
ncbi:MAG: hypothetical protein CR982_04245 [Candidatus Cloacimonadota bacterium]|nr:MAG: hypothetical protein CR982_04245 [Candidatus Cloacimonadota bacterium]PIE78490.1 MAG: hypothetical protein CSA15_07285 [Candidatus Delongbacteria bacterium]